MIDTVKHARLAAGLKWGIGLLAVALMSTLIVNAAIGLVGLAVIGAVSLAIVHLAPLASRWMATVALQGFKGLARKNPVETRQLIAVKRRAELAEALKAINAFTAEVINVEGHVKDLNRAGDNDGANELQQTANKLRQVLELRKSAWQRATAAADEYDKVTDKVARRWKAAQAALKAQRLAGTSASKELDRIMSEEALESVETAMNTVFAELEGALMTESIEYKPADVIEVSVTPVKETVK